MPISRRYHPEWVPGEKNSIGMDFSTVIPPGIGLSECNLFITTPSGNNIVDSSTDFTGTGYKPAVGADAGYFTTSIADRIAYVPDLAGGTVGKDYRFSWNAIDTSGNEWLRSVQLLCSYTS
jgi:hypothetical protein